MSAVRPGRNPTGIGMTSQRTRERMVERLREQGILDARVLAARPACRPPVRGRSARQPGLRRNGAADRFGQTISQPFVVARMIGP